MPKKKLCIKLEIEIEGEDGIERFAGILRALWDAGYQDDVRSIVSKLVAEAKKHGAAVPAELERLAYA